MDRIFCIDGGCVCVLLNWKAIENPVAPGVCWMPDMLTGIDRYAWDNDTALVVMCLYAGTHVEAGAANESDVHRPRIDSLQNARRDVDISKKCSSPAVTFIVFVKVLNFLWCLLW